MPTATATPAFALVRSLAKPKGKETAKKFAANDPSIQPQIDAWLYAKGEADRFTSLMKSTEDQILSVGVPLLIEECRRAGKIESSIRLNNALTLTHKCQYSPIPADRIDEVKAVLPDERYFTDRLTITLNADAASDDAFLGKLLEALGPDEFASRFTVSRVVLPTEEFHRDVTLRPEVAERAAVFVEDQTIRGYKPALRA